RGVRVRTAGGTAFGGARAVVALPLPALRRIRFEPALPPALAAATEALPYARIARFFLAYPQRAWPDDLGVLTSGAGFVYHATKGQPGPSGALGFYTALDTAERLARLPEPALRAQLARAAREVTGADLPPPAAVARRVWSEEEWSGGCWAAFGPEHHTRFAAALRAPHDRLLFAGEHTATESPGFMEGAVE